MSEELYIIPHEHSVTVKDRNILFGHNSLVVWFTGLSGSGKSTIASALERELYQQKVHTYILDGDNVREGLNSDLNFTAEGRVENIRRIGEVANLMKDAGVVVLSAFVSPFRSDREKVKNLVGQESFIEVFVDCPLEICEQRDVKGLYKKARSGEISNFTGISSPFEKPVNADVHVKSDIQTVKESVVQVMKRIKDILEL